MKRTGWLISKYLWQAVLPYFLFSWVLVSVILFVQQASRFSDIFFNANIPKNLIWQLTLALVPNVIAFTCPMAVLIGVIIGLSRIQGDSELIAMRAAGIGNMQITVPIVFFGILLSLLTFSINLYGVPFAAKIVRKVALQTALYKLESPIEPGVFNTEINGYTIYVKDGDIEKGTWKNIFIYYEDIKGKKLRLITSSEGRIDVVGETSELVLENATVNTISDENGETKLITDNIRQVRQAIKTQRSELIEQISKTEETPEELGLTELASFVRSKTGKEKTEAQILWQRRIILSVTPLIFAILGVSLVLRFNRGGRGFGIVLALSSLIIHYLLTLFGEQLARTGQISVLTAGLIPVTTSFLFITWFFISKRIFSNNYRFKINKRYKTFFTSVITKTSRRSFYINPTTRILDFDIILNLIKYFLLTYVFLTSVYIIFTAFELWKFAGEINNGFALLAKYLFYLLPFIYIQLAPSALMVAVLTTFVIKSRQNEIVTWIAAGQSTYRLLLPCFGLMIFIGFFNWQFQEKILPAANQTQDELRAQIRNRGVLLKKQAKYWVADDKRIYSFEFEEGSNDANQNVKNLAIYEFSDDRTKLKSIYKASAAVWAKDKVTLSSEAEESSWLNGKLNVRKVPNFVINQNVDLLVTSNNKKPSHLNVEETKNLAENSDSDAERRMYQVAMEKKYTNAFLPFVITLFTAPFALSLSRKGRVVTVGYSVGIWLLFIGINSTFEQFGLNDFISPSFAVWSPVIFFTILGIYLLTKVKT
jgi:lipopolysaccharide export LptBFGC system permease protein LptF